MSNYKAFGLAPVFNNYFFNGGFRKLLSMVCLQLPKNKNKNVKENVHSSCTANNYTEHEIMVSTIKN